MTRRALGIMLYLIIKHGNDSKDENEKVDFCADKIENRVWCELQRYTISSNVSFPAISLK